MSWLLIVLTLVVVGYLYIRRMLKGAKCSIDRDMTGEIVLITGSNTGIGLETAKELAKRNATIIMGCRDMKKAQLAANEILMASNNKARVELFKLDLSDLNSVKEFAKQVKSKFSHITILINNAGIYGITEKQFTKQNFEMIFGTNFIGTFYLTEELLPLFKKENENRILNVVTYSIQTEKLDYSYFDSNKEYNFSTVYFNSKMFLTHYTLYLNHALLDSHNIKAVSIHPGVIDTEITRNLKSSYKIIEVILNSPIKHIYTFLIKTPLEGAQCTLQTAYESFQTLKGGKYYYDCKVKEIKLSLKNAEECYHFTKNAIAKVFA